VKPDPIVVVAGSRALAPGLAPRLLVRFLAGLPSEATILLRRGLFRQPNLFEAQVESLCELIGLKVEWCYPLFGAAQKPGTTGPAVDWEEKGYRGRQMTFARDLDMVTRADLVLAFYTIDQVGDDTSGTVGLVEKALEANRVVYAYALTDNRVTRVGEHDPTNEWADRVPFALG